MRNIKLKQIVEENDILQREKNWINLERLFSLQDQCFMEPISRDVYECILQKASSDNGKMLIGVDYYGAILAAVIGYKFDIPFTYCFDADRYVDDIEKEIEDVENLETLDLYIITDVVVSGRRVGRLLDILYSKGILDDMRKVDVIALFERRGEGGLSELYKNPLVRNLYIFDDSFENTKYVIET